MSFHHYQAFKMLEARGILSADAFLGLIAPRPHDKPWSRQQRVNHMLRTLMIHLDRYHSVWKLVRISERGQLGIYELQRRYPAGADGLHNQDRASVQEQASR